jgi:hypothetical protein
MDLLNNAMIAIGANLRSGNPITSAWMKENNQYAFLEFRTPEEANNAFKLDGITIIDKVKFISKTLYQNIKIGRPRHEGEDANTQAQSKYNCF